MGIYCPLPEGHDYHRCEKSTSLTLYFLNSLNEFQYIGHTPPPIVVVSVGLSSIEVMCCDGGSP